MPTGKGLAGDSAQATKEGEPIGIYVDAHLARTINPRRPFVDTEPDGYQESDMDYMRNNAALAVALLNATAKRFPTPCTTP